MKAKFNVLVGLFVILVGALSQAEVRLTESDSQSGYPRYLSYCGGNISVRCGSADRQCRVDFSNVRQCRGVKFYVNDQFRDLSQTYRNSLQGYQSGYYGSFYVDYSKIGGRSSGNKYLNIYLFDERSNRPYEEIRVDLPNYIERDNQGYIISGNYNGSNYPYNSPYSNDPYYNGNGRKIDPYYNRYGTCRPSDYNFPYCKR